MKTSFKMLSWLPRENEIKRMDMQDSSRSRWRSMQLSADKIVMRRSPSSPSEPSDSDHQISTMILQRVRSISDCVSMESSSRSRVSPDQSTSSSSNDSNTSLISSSTSRISHKMANTASRQAMSGSMCVSRRSRSAMGRMSYVVYSTPLGRYHRWMISDSCGHRRGRSTVVSRRKMELSLSRGQLDQGRRLRSTRCSRASTLRIARSSLSRIRSSTSSRGSSRVRSMRRKTTPIPLDSRLSCVRIQISS